MLFNLAQNHQSINKNITISDECNVIYVEKTNHLSLALNNQIIKLKLKNPRLKTQFFNEVILFNNWFSNEGREKHYCLFMNGNEFNYQEIDVNVDLDIHSFTLNVFYENQIEMGGEILNGLNVIFRPLESASEINFQVYNENPDLIFIDDDDILCRAWRLKADLSNKAILCFNNAAEFEKIMDFISPQTPIYIDSNLGDHELGEKVSKKFHDAGFKSIFLATGRYSLDIIKPQWIQAIVNKSPPF